MHPFPPRVIEVGIIIAAAAAVAAVIGLLILIAPNFGLKPKPTVDGWRFPVKPTCLLLYYLALVGGMGVVGLSTAQMLAAGTTHWFAWLGFAFGFFLVPLVLADWPEPLILDGQGLFEGGCTSSRILWQELKHVRAYRIRCDRGVVIQGDGGKQLVVADIAYDSGAVLDCLLQWRQVPYYSLHDDMAPLSIFTEPHSRY